VEAYADKCINKILIDAESSSVYEVPYLQHVIAGNSGYSDDEKPNTKEPLSQLRCSSADNHIQTKREGILTSDSVILSSNMEIG
jgi:hypothetical protein